MKGTSRKKTLLITPVAEARGETQGADLVPLEISAAEFTAKLRARHVVTDLKPLQKA